MKLKNALILLLTATIWGVAFVAQSEGSKAAGPFSFNGIRNIIAGVFLLVFILLKNMIKAGSADSQEEKYNKKDINNISDYYNIRSDINNGNRKLFCELCYC